MKISLTNNTRENSIAASIIMLIVSAVIGTSYKDTIGTINIIGIIFAGMSFFSLFFFLSLPKKET